MTDATRWMSRRDFLWMGSGFALSPLAVRGQPRRTLRVGIVANPPEVEVIERGLRSLGWRPDENIAILAQSPDGRLDLAKTIIEEFVRLPVDVLVVFTDAAASVAIRATRTIPVVMLTTGAILEDGLVASLARPDRNLTGLSFDAPREITGKRLALLKAMAPRVSRVAFLIESVGGVPSSEHESRATTPETKAAAQALGLSVVPIVFRSSPQELDRALDETLRARADGVLVSEGVLVTIPEHQERIHEFAARHRLPTLHSVLSAAESGGLMAYGLNFQVFLSRLPHFIDRILRGAKPSDLPIEQPSKLHLVVNGKTARGLGLSVPGSMRLQADRVIE